MPMYAYKASRFPTALNQMSQELFRRVVNSNLIYLVFAKYLVVLKSDPGCVIQKSLLTPENQLCFFLLPMTRLG